MKQIKQLLERYHIKYYFGNDINELEKLINKLSVTDIFFYFSSYTVFGNISSISMKGAGGSSEFDRHAPTTIGALKYSLCEQYCLMVRHRYSKKVTVIRPYTVFGTDDPENCINKILNDFRTTNKVTIFAEGKQYRDFIHIDDVVSVLKLIIKSGITHESYNIGNDLAVSMKSIASTFPSTCKIQFSQETTTALYNVRCDSELIKSIGYKPTYNIMDWLDKEIYG